MTPANRLRFVAARWTAERWRRTRNWYACRTVGDSTMMTGEWRGWSMEIILTVFVLSSDTWRDACRAVATAMPAMQRRSGSSHPYPYGHWLCWLWCAQLERPFRADRLQRRSSTWTGFCRHWFCTDIRRHVTRASIKNGFQINYKPNFVAQPLERTFALNIWTKCSQIYCY